MRTGIALGLALAFGCSAAAQEVQVKGQVAAKGKASDGTQAFVGVWVPQSCIVKGQEQLPQKADRDAIRLSIENGEYKLYILTDAEKMIGRRVSTAELSVDEKAGTFELTIKEGVKKGVKLHGIFELTKVSLKMCYGPAEKPRPAKFEAAAESDNFYETWERHKK